MDVVKKERKCPLRLLSGAATFETDQKKPVYKEAITRIPEN